MIAEEIDLRESRAARGIRSECVGEVAENARIAVINAGVDQELLLGFDREVLPIRSALRRVGVLIRQLDEGSTALRRTEDAGMPTGR